MSNDASRNGSAATSNPEMKIPKGKTPGDQWLNIASQTMVLPRLITLDHMNKAFAANRRRVNDAHARQQAAWKLANPDAPDPLPVPESEADEVAITIDGDKYYNVQPQQPAGNGFAKALPWIAAMLMGGTGLLAPTIHQWINTPTAAAESRPESDWQLGLEVTDEP